jgi:carbohydrate-selective porin OprB
VVCNNPFQRNALDQIGIAAAVNKLSQTANGTGTRSVESIAEAYWAFGVSDFMTITPDIQLYINPGADPDHRTATVASIRATLMF